MSHNSSDHLYNDSDVSQDSTEHSIALIKDQQTEKSTDKEADPGISIYSLDSVNDVGNIKIVNHDYVDRNNIFDPTDLSTMIPDDTPFLLDLWNKTKHICSLCLCFVGCLIIIYLLFIIFSGGIQTDGQVLSIDSTSRAVSDQGSFNSLTGGTLDTPRAVKLE